MDGLSILRRTSDPRTINLASFHDPASLTWSWILSFGTFRADEARVWPIFRRDYLDRGWTVRIPLIGFIRWHTQAKMMRANLRALSPKTEGEGT